MPERIIPEKMQVETTLQVILPPEVTALLRAFYADRQGIAWGGIVLLGCVVALTLRRVFSRS